MVFVDELADGLRGAALPGMQHAFGLGYAGVGLLTALPILIGGLLELPLGFFARRRLLVLAGGLVFVASLAAVAVAPSLVVLLVASVVFYPASGAFVSLTQANLMDAWPQRQAQVMARWDLAGEAGALLGPAGLIVALMVGGSWRTAYLGLAALSAVVWLGMWRADPAERQSAAERTRLRDLPSVLRATSALRWALLMEVANLLVDVATGFVAVYLVDVAHAPVTLAAIAVTIRLLAALGGDALLVIALERFSDMSVLRVSAVTALAMYPAFLLVPTVAWKLAVLVPLSAATACWYPVLNARLYTALPERSSVAVTLSTAAGLAGGLGPLAVGFAAGRIGLTWAMALLVVAPMAVLWGARGQPPEHLYRDC